MQLQINLLGTVELRVDGQPVTVGAAKRRTVLAGLALEANRPVPLDRLARMVWGDRPPTSAVANLRSHVFALRAAVGDRIVARAHAYELRIGAHELDVTEFQRLAGEGRALLAAGDPSAAVPALAAALACWRGPAGSGLPTGTTLNGRWVSLEEQRLQVFEELTQARLDLGESGGLLDGLRQHLSAHPLRERGWSQLMVALYRCGDVPAALAAYQHARSALDEQLGIEPGDELVALHRAILDRTPGLAVPAASPSTAVGGRSPVGGAGRAVPRELPADLVTFVARTAQVAAVTAAVTGAPPAAEFPDGQVFVDLGYHPSAGADEVLGRVLRALGVPSAEVPTEVDEQAGRLRSLVADRRILLVVDGVTHTAQVRPLVPAGPGPALLVVAQRHLPSLDGTTRVAVPGLRPDESLALLTALVDDGRPTRDPEATAELLRICAGSPLAVRIVGSRLAARPGLAVGALVEQLRDDRYRLDWLTYDGLSVRDRLADSYLALRAADEVAARMFVLLGGAPDEPVTPEWAATRLGVAPATARRALEELVDAHLADRAGADGYVLPALVRDHAAELAATPAGRWPRRRAEVVPAYPGAG